MPAIDDEGRRISNPDGTLVEEASSWDSSDQSEYEVDISQKTFRYNPPMHKANLSKVSDFSEATKVGTAKSRTANFYDEDKAPSSYADAWAKDGLKTLRLGRIIQHHIAPGQVSMMDHRWGFRFLYNPSSISYVSSRNDSFIIDPRSETNRVLSGVFQNFQSVSFTVLLDRLPDVMSGIPSLSDYSPKLSGSDRSGIRRYGTHWDMEALLRLCNGEWELTDRGKTSNIGILIPSNARLILGPGINFYGFVGSVTWKDELFSADMVPVRTRLDIVFRRHVEMSAEQAKESFPGIASSESPSSSEGGDGGSGGGGGGGDDGDYSGDVSLPSGYRNGRSNEAAATYAESRIGRDADFNRRCLAWVSRQVFQSPTRGIQEAHMVWDNSPRSMHHSGDYSAPRGSIVLWNDSIGGGAGHIAVSLGGGQMASTAPGGVRRMSIKGFSDRAYLGWMPPYFTLG